MKVIAFNGSPRKNFSTALLLRKALEGAEATGAETELVNLYDIDFKGCVSCFLCKVRNGKTYGRCAHRDGILPYLEKAAEADAVIIGSPVYLGRVSGETASFLERLVFPFISYADYRTLAPRKSATAMIYAMNVTEPEKNEYEYDTHFRLNESFMKRTFGSCETLCSFNTLQGTEKDYERFELRGTIEEKMQYRSEHFDSDLRKAFELGGRLCRV
ncbi:flavodoxin family protein [Geovibrio thiophilus]|uniref:Flavodoxin family protein n=1 Tax=Geovibrio thiophilus TaxID=139438 RepID=A0A410K0P6_9BACT|nr:flavodoxin family protein [Geovibrio thiophilus]QAR33997.1 flavodoxin family protein [Geovibrio thiophilus]